MNAGVGLVLNEVQFKLKLADIARGLEDVHAAVGVV